MAEFRLRALAEDDLETIWRYTQREWGEGQADLYVDMLVAAMKTLAETPYSAPTCDHIRIGYRRRLVASHLIYFKTTDYGIDVVRVLHERMHAVSHL